VHNKWHDYVIIIAVLLRVRGQHESKLLEYTVSLFQQMVKHAAADGTAEIIGTRKARSAAIQRCRELNVAYRISNIANFSQVECRYSRGNISREYFA
jgi:hypothetical protein